MLRTPDTSRCRRLIADAPASRRVTVVLYLCLPSGKDSIGPLTRLRDYASARDWLITTEIIEQAPSELPGDERAGWRAAQDAVRTGTAQGIVMAVASACPHDHPNPDQLAPWFAQHGSFLTALPFPSAPHDTGEHTSEEMPTSNCGPAFRSLLLPSAGTQYMACGEGFGAVRLRSFEGVLLAKRLGEQGGAVIEDRTGTDADGRGVWRLVWLVPPGSITGGDLPGAEVLGMGTWLEVPSLNSSPPVWWTRPPDDAGGNLLTDPELLHRALVAMVTAQRREAGVSRA